MKRKLLASLLLMTIFFSSLSLVGCANNGQNNQTPTPTPTPTQTTPSETTPDVTTTASIVDNAEAFEKAISSTGTWIICITKDITTDKELVLEGEFKNGKKDENGKDIVQRKIALYSQDSNRNITARYTLTAPRLTIQSPEASIQHGTFKGDIYVSAKNFKLVDTKVEGNVYFTNEEAQTTFTKDDTSTITGVTELKK